MKQKKLILLSISLICIALLGFALYLQFMRDMLPCPLCIMQRYAFALVGLLCLIAATLPPLGMRITAGLATLAAMGGAGIAGRHLWIKANPTVSCGIDPLETLLNKLPFADWLPFLFQADGLCTTEYDPIFGLSIPQWSLVWFVLIAIVLATVTLRRR